MKIGNYKLKTLKTKKPKRIGRGQGSGWGTTAGRGQDGQKSRSGGPKPPWFEGGQMPLARRLPKRGFTNIFAKEYSEVNINKLNSFDEGTVVTPELLLKSRILRKIEKDGVKILGKGDIEKALTVRAHRFTKGAQEKIEKASGKIEVI